MRPPISPITAGDPGVAPRHRRDHHHDFGLAACTGLGEFAARVLEEEGSPRRLRIGARRRNEAQNEQAEEDGKDGIVSHGGSPGPGR